MDVSAFTLVTAGMMPEEGTMAVPGTAAIGGDTFAKLMSGLGIAPVPATGEALVVGDLPAAEAAAADGEAPPVDPAMLLTGHPAGLGQPRPAKGEGAKPSMPASSDEREGAAETETPTPASLGLPPLLAALVAPTLAQAAPAKPTISFAADRPASAEGVPVALPTGAAVPTIAAPAPQGRAPIAASLQPIASATVTPVPAQQADAAGAATVDAARAAPAIPATPPGASSVAAPAFPSSPAVVAKLPVTLATASATADESPPSTAAVAASSLPAAAPEQAEGIAKLPQPGASPPALMPRRGPSTPARADTTERSTSPEKPSPMLDIVAPLSAKPLPAAAALPMPLDIAAAPVGSAPAPVEAPAPAEQIIEHQLDMAHEGEWLDQLTRDIVRTASAEGGLRFKLNPEHLGSLHVEVTQGQAGASVRLTADTEQARTIIADARPQLIAEARAQGLRISEAHVDLNGQGHSQAQSQAGNGGRSGRDAPAQEYLTSWQPESAEEKATPSRRSTAERYA